MAARPVFGSQSQLSNIPGQGHEDVVVGTEFTHVARKLYVGVGGDVSVQDVNDVTCVYKNVPNGGTIGPLLCKKVTAVVTASNIIAIY
jgi:hypothetical protein